MYAWRIGFLAIARRWWPIVALATGAGALLAYLYSSTVPPTYEAEAKLVVTAPGTDLGALQAATELAPTYAELVRSTRVLERTVQALDGRVTAADLRENVRGEWDQETRLLTVRARSRDPAVAVLTANALARQLVREASTKSPAPEAGESTPRTELGIVEPATDAVRVRPQSALLMRFGALAGLFLALALALLVELGRGTVRDEDDLAELTAGAVLGSVDGGLSRPADRELGEGAGRGGADSYRRLAERVVAAGGEEVPRGLLVFGAQGDTGSGTVAANLAAALAGRGMDVILADLDEKLEAVGLFAAGAGGTDGTQVERYGALRHGGIVLDRLALRSEDAPLLVVPRGGPPRSLDVAAARGLVEVLLAEADVVVLHSGPLPRSPRSLTLAHAADVTILVVRREHTRRDSVTSTLDSLDLARAKVVGTVLHTSRRRS